MKDPKRQNVKQQHATAHQSQHTPQPAPVKKKTSRNRHLQATWLRWSPFVYAVVFIVGAAWALLAKESEFLYRVSELNLFLPNEVFFHQYMVLPGGMMSYMGAFLTQFCYYPWLGTTVLALTWIALILLTRKAFRISNRWSILLLIPVALLLAAQMQQGYSIYNEKLKGYFFANTCGIMFALSTVWCYRNMTHRYGARLIVMLMTSAVGYPLFGAYALLGTLWMALWNWTERSTNRVSMVARKMPDGKEIYEKKEVRESTKGKIMDTVMAVLIVLVVPVAWYQCYSQTGLAFIYMAGLPNFHINGASITCYRMPFFALFLFPVIPFLIHFFTKADDNGQDVKLKFSYYLWQLIFIGCIIGGLYACWYKDGNFHKELAMNHCIENCDWEGVLNIARDETDTPTRLMVQNKNLALFRLGRAGDEMYNYLDGGQRSNAPFEVRMMQVGGKELYFHYGKLNFCYRWCMEDGVEYGWKVDYIKFLAKTSLLSGEYKLARRYLNTLKETWFFRDWAVQQEKFLQHPSLLKTDKEYGPVTHMLDYKDQLDGDNALVEMYLLASFAHSDGNDPLYQEATLIAALNMKDIALFWPRFNKYAIFHVGHPMPIHYQEAAYLYGHLEHKVDISRMPFDKQVVQRYNDFIAFSQQCQGMTTEQMAKAFYPMFGNTFYYFYFLIRGVKSY
jgi:hypothetical protein